MELKTVVIKIQRKFLAKKFISEVKKYKKLFDELNKFTTQPQHLFDNEKQQDINFCEMRHTLVKKDNINAINKILSLMYRCLGEDKLIAPRIDARKFMIGWMIVSFPEFMMEIKDPENKEKKDQYPYDIYLIIKDFIFYTNLLHKINNPTKEILRIFKKSLNKYSNAVNYFLKRDKNEQIQKLLNEFANINKTISNIKKSKKYTDEDQRHDCIETITKTKTKIATHLKKLDSGIDICDLEVQSQIHNAIEENMEKAMCDILINDIENKKFNYFSKFIDDVSNQMIHLGAKKIDSGFESKIDKDFIIQKMTYLDTEHKHIVEYGDYMINIINNLQSPITVDTTKDAWEKIKTDTDCKNQLLGKLVVFTLKELKDIYETIDNLNTLASTSLM
jgi:gas vesicle protein